MREEGKRASLLCALIEGVVAVCALAGFAVCFLSLYGDIQPSFISDLTPDALRFHAKRPVFFAAIAALFAAVGVAAWRLPRFSRAAAGGLSLLWAVCLWYNFPHVRNGAAYVVYPVAGSVCRCMNIGFDFSYSSRYGRVRNQQDVQLFLLLSLFILALALGWAVVRARRWWLAVALTLPPLLPALLLTVYPSLPALTVLAAAWCALLFSGLCRNGAPGMRAKLTGISLLCSALVLSTLLAILPREGYTRPAWALSLNNRLMDIYRTFTDSPAPDTLPTPTGTIRAGSAGRADLSHAGPLHFSGRTVLRVRTDYGGRLYLRGASLGIYDAGVWKPVPESAYDNLIMPSGPSGTTVSALVFPTFYGSAEQPCTAEIEDIGSGGGRVYVPYYPASMPDWGQSGIAPIDDAYFARQDLSRTHTVTFVPHVGGTGYVTEMIVGRDGYYYYDFIQDNYLAVPEETARAIRAIPEAEEFLAALDTSSYLQCAHEAASFLARQCEYDPRTPAIPAGQDPVPYFLSESRRGYCMHFASAAALLLRMAGIPARYVSGYVADCVPDERVNVPDRAAHAWIEVWTDTIGWQPVEVTPAAAMDLYATGVLPDESSSASESAASSRPDSASEPSSSSSRPGAPSQTGASPDDFPLVRILGNLFLFFGIALLPVLAWLGRLLLKWYRARRLTDRNVNRAAIYSYRCLCRLSRWGGRVEPQAVELAQKARFSLHTLAPEEMELLRGMFTHERARLCDVLPPVWRFVFCYIWGWP